MKPKRIIVQACQENGGNPVIPDALQQVAGYFDLLTDEGRPDISWQLVSASTNSPLTVDARPFDQRTKAPAFGQVRGHVVRMELNLLRLLEGQPPDNDFPAEKRDVAKRMFRRNLNGIGCTIITLEGDRPCEIRPPAAKRALDMLTGNEDAEHACLFRTCSRAEAGSVEGRVVALDTDRKQPSFTIRQHGDGRKIRCRISAAGRDAIAARLTAHRLMPVLVKTDPSGTGACTGSDTPASLGWCSGVARFPSWPSLSGR